MTARSSPATWRNSTRCIRDSPWTEDRMEKVYDKLFDGCREHAEAHADLTRT